MIKKLAFLLSIALLSSSRVDGTHWMLYFLEPSERNRNEIRCLFYNVIPSHHSSGYVIGCEGESRGPRDVIQELRETFGVRSSDRAFIEVIHHNGGNVYIFVEKGNLPDSIEERRRSMYLQCQQVFDRRHYSHLESFSVAQVAEYMFQPLDSIPKLKISERKCVVS